MSSKFVLIVTLFVIAEAIAGHWRDPLIQLIEDEVLPLTGNDASSGDSYNCDLVHMNAQQYNFNQALNLTASLIWKDALTLDNAVLTLLATSIDDYVAICNNRKNFFNSLGATYSDCTNPLFLMSQLDPDTNITQAYVYASMWNELDFFCNGGFEIGVQSFHDIWAVFSTPAYQTCAAVYITNVTKNPADFCNIVQTYAYCVQEAYINEAQIRQNGWWLCEGIRHGYAESCHNFRCNILTT
uniref:Uncharacterized protein n=1 Tax=Panagrellus redivivus TaxID=6233 RepID=A0A7E4V907_PANRE